MDLYTKGGISYVNIFELVNVTDLFSAETKVFFKHW